MKASPVKSNSQEKLSNFLSTFLRHQQCQRALPSLLRLRMQMRNPSMSDSTHRSPRSWIRSNASLSVASEIATMMLTMHVVDLMRKSLSSVDQNREMFPTVMSTVKHKTRAMSSCRRTGRQANGHAHALRWPIEGSNYLSLSVASTEL